MGKPLFICNLNSIEIVYFLKHFEIVSKKNRKEIKTFILAKIRKIIEKLPNHEFIINN